ncbi:hypothetical protein [Amycolatopsis taiwanensis]|uniref:hypothetical protein n=1 Tax=Amycolatopsis taiwanensis TaxID=342230 RepID=UPI000486C948|nr:hypothetical protein [Amycolatopsis taiwanensis]
MAESPTPCARPGCPHTVLPWLDGPYHTRACARAARTQRYGAGPIPLRPIAHEIPIPAPVVKTNPPDPIAAIAAGLPLPELEYGEPVGFDQPPAKGFLARAIERIFG